MRNTVANLSQTPRRLGLVNIIGLYTYGPGCLARTGGCILVLIAIWAGLRNYWIEKTAFRSATTVQGAVIETDYTGWTFNDYEQKIIYFRYDVDGRPFEGFSYALRGSWQKGREVDVEYNPKNPSQARIVGLDYAKLHFLVYIPVILALLFAIGAVTGTLKAYRWGRLLEHGAVAEAEVVQGQVGQNKDKSQITHIPCQFTDAAGQVHQIKAGLTAKVRTKQKNILFYDPANPQRFMFLSQAPHKLKLAAPGKWARSEQTRQIFGWFAVSFGLLIWVIYALGKLFNPPA